MKITSVEFNLKDQDQCENCGETIKYGFLYCDKCISWFEYKALEDKQDMELYNNESNNVKC